MMEYAMSNRSRNYTVSTAAKQGLINLFCRTQTITYHDSDGLSHTETKPILSSRQTRWAQGYQVEYDPYAKGSVSYSTDRRSTYYEGLSHAIIQVARNYDYDDWEPKPSTDPITKLPTLWYTPPDRRYLQDTLPLYQEDYTSFSDREKAELEAELALDHRYDPRYKGRGYGMLSLALPEDTRRYLLGLLQYYDVPPCPTRRYTPSNLTAKISWCLEVIGSNHLVPAQQIAIRSGRGLDEGVRIITLQQLVNEPNSRKAQAVKSRQGRPNQLTHTYGNHAHEWHDRYFDIKRKPPSMTHLDRWTQDDIEWANTHGLKDLAKEALTLQGLEQPDQPHDDEMAVDPNPTLDVYEIAQRKLLLDSSPHPNPTSSNQEVYTYKGRDITEPIMLAYQAHYIDEPSISFPKLEPLAKEWKLPLYVLRNLTTKEHVRQALLETQTEPTTTTQRAVSTKTIKRPILMERLNS